MFLVNRRPRQLVGRCSNSAGTGLDLLATFFLPYIVIFLIGAFILTWIVFGCKYSFRPSGPLSRPIPLCLNPPNGVCGDGECEELMATVPASILPAIRRALAMSEVYTVAVGMFSLCVCVIRGRYHLQPRPYVVAFASSMASASSLNVLIEMTGPKISSV